MSEREDRKLVQVPVASYNYRHEAEFAAGFLEDAGIPYRLQIEDPTLGLSATNSATLWVTAMDEGRARQVLEQERAVDPDEDDAGESREDAEPGEESPARGPGPLAGATRAAAGRPPQPNGIPDRGRAGVPSSRRAPAVDSYGNVRPDLTLRQRLISLGGSVAVASTLAVDAVREAPTAVSVVVALIAVGLLLVALFGRAPGPLKGLLAALSGDIP